jgi:hypothetical protein
VAPPSTVEWSALSPRSLEIAKQVGLRCAAGYAHDEIAVQIESTRGQVRNLELPEGPITKAWVAKLLTELRREIQATTTAD